MHAPAPSTIGFGDEPQSIASISSVVPAARSQDGRVNAAIPPAFTDGHSDISIVQDEAR
jgi:hypothetical protein